MERSTAPAEAGKPALSARPLMDGAQADELARLFKMLASDTRLRLLHALVRAQEMCVTDLAAELGMAPQAVSNQLQRLTDRRIVAARRAGNRLFYRVADPCVAGFLDLGLCLLEESGVLPVATAGDVDGEQPG
jgi:ArsR family transcriptional regulator, lead/cadmium/zinc/bismuth-responsive transcriptional repressor